MDTHMLAARPPTYDYTSLLNVATCSHAHYHAIERPLRQLLRHLMLLADSADHDLKARALPRSMTMSAALPAAMYVSLGDHGAACELLYLLHLGCIGETRHHDWTMEVRNDSRVSFTCVALGDRRIVPLSELPCLAIAIIDAETVRSVNSMFVAQDDGDQCPMAGFLARQLPTNYEHLALCRLCVQTLGPALRTRPPQPGDYLSSAMIDGRLICAAVSHHRTPLPDMYWCNSNAPTAKIEAYHCFCLRHRAITAGLERLSHRV